MVAADVNQLKLFGSGKDFAEKKNSRPHFGAMPKSTPTTAPHQSLS
jgi:hypothetical protein